MNLRELFFGSLESVRLGRDPSDCDQRVVSALVEKGRAFHSLRRTRSGLLEISRDDNATPQEIKVARRIFRESVGIGERPTEPDWGC